MAKDDDWLNDMEDRWLAAAETGRRLAAVELCADRPDLLEALEKRLAILQCFRRIAGDGANPLDNSSRHAGDAPGQNSRGHIPDPEHYTKSFDQIIEACTAFASAWDAGERPSIQSYLTAVGAEQRAILFHNLLAIESHRRRVAGEGLVVDEYLRLFPEFAPLVRREFPDNSTLSMNAPGTAGGSATDNTARVASRLGNYRIIAELGRGGMGVVYKAEDLHLGRIVALKMILGGRHASETELARFLTEARAVAALKHPSIVQIYETGDHNGLPFFTLELMEGGSLAGKVRDNPLAPAAAARIVEQVACGVHYAHTQGILHRDLKPDNVLLAADGTPKLTDFGLAKRVEEEVGMTVSGAVMGTPSYMAPEQAVGDTKRIGPSTDVYGLGALLYRLIAGRPPFLGANTIETLRQVSESEPVSPSELVPGLPRDLSTICLKCLAKEPAKRYATAADLAEDLRRFLKREPILARPVGRIERATKWVRRNPVVTGATVAVILALAAGATASYVKYRDVEAARSAEAKRVEERDAALGKRDAALETANARERDMNYQVGVHGFLLASAAFDSRDVQLALERLKKVPVEQRGWEWHYLHRQCEGGIFSLRGHTGKINCVAYSPDGTRIATAGYDKTARIWDARTGIPLLELKGHKGPVSIVAFTKDGTRIVTAGASDVTDFTVKVWNARTGTQISEVKGHAEAIAGFGVSSDGIRVASLSRGPNDIQSAGVVKIRDACTGTQLLDLKKDGQSWHPRVVFSSDGTRIAMADGVRCKLWDARTGAIVMETALEWPHSLDFSPDGTRMILGSGIVDARTGNKLVELQDWVGGGSAFSLDGARIASGSGIWDAHTGALLDRFLGPWAKLGSIAFSPDGTNLVTPNRDGTATVWDAHGRTPVRELSGQPRVSMIAISPDGAFIATANDGKPKTVRISEARTGRPIVEFLANLGIEEGIAFSPDGRRIAANGNDEKSVTVWETHTGVPLLELAGHTAKVTSIAYSPDGTRIATKSEDRYVKIWDARTGDLISHFMVADGSRCDVAFSPDGMHLAVAVSNREIRVFDASAGRAVLNLTGHQGGSYRVNLTFSPDGKNLAASSTDGTVNVWDTRTGTMLSKLEVRAGITMSVVFSPDSKRIVTCAELSAVKIWDVRTGTPLLELKEDTGYAFRVGTSAAFSADGERLYACLWGKPTEGIIGGRVRIWDTRLGRQDIGNGFFLNQDESQYRLGHTRPNLLRYGKGYEVANRVGNRFGACFYLDRILSMPSERTTERFEERNNFQADPRLIARASFHYPDLTKAPYDRSVVQALAVAGDRLAKRLVAQEHLREGKPKLAIPLLYECLLTRPVTDPPKPPVEELLLSLAHRQMNQLDDAKRFHRVATDWLDRPRNPMRAANIVTHAINPWNAIGEAFKPIDDPRHNTFDWESWHECDVFRAEVEKALR